MQVSRVNTDGSVCGTKYCLGNNFVDLTKVIDGDTRTGATYSSFGELLNLASISVKDYGKVYPAGYVAGFLFSKQNFIEIALLNSISVSTYLNGKKQETKSIGNLFSANILTTQNYETYLTFITSKSFDEIRFETAGLTISVLNGITVKEAFAFDPVNAPLANVTGCNRPISSIAARVAYDGPGICAVCGLIDGDQDVNSNKLDGSNIVDGNSNNYTNLVTVASVLSKPSVSVLNTAQVYPAGYNAGFVISPTEQNNLAMVSFFNSVIVETYLFGQLQESINTGTGYGSFVSARLLSFNNNEERLKIGFKTTKAFNEIRYRQFQGANVSFGATKIYYAYAEQGDCLDCKTYFGKEKTGKYSGKLVPNDTGIFGIIKNLYNGVYGLGLHSISNVNNVVTPSNTDYATYNFPLFFGIGAGAKFTVTNDGSLLPAGTTAGFEFKRQTGLINSSLLNYVVIKTYKVTGSKVELVETGTGNGALLAFDVFGLNAGKGTVGFKTTKPFNAVQVDVSSGLLNANLGASIDVYGGYVFEDADGDGYGDCIDICAGDDSQDSDGDGIPDDCDKCRSGNIPPDVGALYKRNYCELGERSVKLPSAAFSQTPTGAILEWHTSLPATVQNKLTNLEITQSGSYYAVFSDPAYPNCYSGAQKVDVEIRNCLLPDFTPDFLYGVGVLGNTNKGLGIEITNIGELANTSPVVFDLYTNTIPNNYIILTYDQGISQLLINDKTITVDNNKWDYVINTDKTIRFSTKPGYQITLAQSVVGVSIAWDPNSPVANMDLRAKIVNGSGEDSNDNNNLRVLPLMYKEDPKPKNAATAEQGIAKVALYPNPASISEVLNVTTGTDEVMTYEVYAINQSGKAVKTGTFTNKLSISGLAQGQYILKLYSKTVNKSINFIVR